MVGTQVQEALRYIADHYLAPLPGITGAYPCPDFNAPAHPPKWAQAHKTALLRARVSVPIRRLGLRDLQEVIQRFTRETSHSRTQQHAGYSSLHLSFRWALLLLNACFPSSARLRQLSNESKCTLCGSGMSRRFTGYPRSHSCEVLGYPERISPPSRAQGRHSSQPLHRATVEECHPLCTGWPLEPKRRPRGGDLLSGTRVGQINCVCTVTESDRVSAPTPESKLSP